MSRHVDNAARRWHLRPPTRPDWLRMPASGGTLDRWVDWALVRGHAIAFIYAFALGMIGAGILDACQDHGVVDTLGHWVMLICWALLIYPLGRRMESWTDPITDDRTLNIRVGSPYPVLVKDPDGE